MLAGKQYPFIAMDSRLGEASLQPRLPITLSYQENSIEASGLLDTGATVNVMPYQLGLDLGANWEQQTTPLQLSGNLARYEARALLLSVFIGEFEAVQLIFAWTKATDVPLLFGQVNFFMEFDVCFSRSQLTFSVQPKKQ